MAGDTLPQAPTASASPVPAHVRDRIDRGLRSMGPYEPLWEEALAFFDNEQYVERSAVNGALQRLETREGDAKAKPRFRSRLTRNRYTAAIERAQSRYAARFPVPRCTAPSHNAEAINAAKLAEKACISAFHKLRVKQLALDTMVYTFNCGAGYVWPYWNSGVGEFIIVPEAQPQTGPLDPETGQPATPQPARLLRTGEIDFHLLHPKQVGWEPGVEFEKSRWYFVRVAQPVSEVENREGYTGPRRDSDGKGGLKADATADPRERSRDATTADLVWVYHYLERPSKQHKQGRWQQIADGQQIAAERTYPCDQDIPVIHQLEDKRRPHRDRPMGRGELMLDVQRTYNRTINQIVAWKNLILNPQLLAPKGSILTPVTEEPGAVIQYRPVGGQVPQWRQVPEIPMSLFRTLDQCLSDWQEISGEGDLGDTESGTQAAVLVNERDQSRRATFSENLAVFYAAIFEHILYLMQRHYTEPRLLEVKTRFGTESIADFLGAKLMPGTTVHVEPGSIAPRTAEAQEAKLIAYADRGWIPPHQVMAAIRAGDADAIIDEFELDIAKAHREIQQLIAMGRGEGLGPVFAGPQDNHAVHTWVLGAWMKTEDFERMDELVKQATLYHLEQHNAEMMFQMAQQQAQQQADAAGRGLQNATRSGDGPPVGGQEGQGGPSLPSVESNVRALQGAPTRS